MQADIVVRQTKPAGFENDPLASPLRAAGFRRAISSKTLAWSPARKAQRSMTMSISSRLTATWCGGLRARTATDTSARKSEWRYGGDVHTGENVVEKPEARVFSPPVSGNATPRSLRRSSAHRYFASMGRSALIRQRDRATLPGGPFALESGARSHVPTASSRPATQQRFP